MYTSANSNITTIIETPISEKEFLDHVNRVYEMGFGNQRTVVLAPIKENQPKKMYYWVCVGEHAKEYIEIRRADEDFLSDGCVACWEKYEHYSQALRRGLAWWGKDIHLDVIELSPSGEVINHFRQDI